MILTMSSGKCLSEGLMVQRVEGVGDTAIFHAHVARTSNRCPQCARPSRQRHGQYRLTLLDLPAHGKKVRLDLTVRRYRCATEGCRVQTFSEGFGPDLARPHGRRTTRLRSLVHHLGIALGGRPAQALSGRLLLPVSKDTFLRGVRQTEDLAVVPRVIGIDDWAWRRGQRYGTLICDLEMRRVIDLLPDREPATVEAWLRDHAEIEVVARDRNGGYGGAVSRALPEAVQVADRWHLLENASAAFLSAVHKAMPAIRKALG